MTVAEMVYAVNLKLRSLEELRRRLFITLDYNFLFNESVDEFVRNAYQVYDRTELERKILAPLVSNYSTSLVSSTSSLLTNLPNGYTISLPSDLLFILEEHIAKYNMVSSNSDSSGGGGVPALAPASLVSITPIKPITYDSYLVDRSNPFKYPYTNLFWRLDYGSGKHELITDGTALNTATVHSYYVARYIRRATTIDVNAVSPTATCDLPAIYHDTIVNMVVQKASSIIRAAATMAATQDKEEEPREEQRTKEE